MTYTARVLVIANVTATSEDLIDALRARAERGDARFTLLMPGGDPAAALAVWREAGIEADGIAGDADAICAVHDVWAPARFDEVIVSTLPGEASKWLRFDLPHRVARITDAQVVHVVARRPGTEHVAGHPPPPRERDPLGPLAVLTWGGRH